jgi:hypothetical protein
MEAKKRLEDYSWEELLEATSAKEALKEAGRDSGYYTLDNNLGIHTDDLELRREWALMGGYSNIDYLLQWQKENNHNIGQIAKVKSDEWCNNISKSLTGRKLSKTHIENNRNAVKKHIDSLTKKERTKKYSNDSASKKSLDMRTKILNLIETDTFTTSEARKACDEYGLGNWKAFLKDKRIIKQIHKGTNQNNPSIYQKLNN